MQKVKMETNFSFFSGLVPPCVLVLLNAWSADPFVPTAILGEDLSYFFPVYCKSSR